MYRNLQIPILQKLNSSSSAITDIVTLIPTTIQDYLGADKDVNMDTLLYT